MTLNEQLVQDYNSADDSQKKAKLKEVDINQVNSIINDNGIKVDQKVQFIRRWTKYEDSILLQIRAYCLLEPIIRKDKVQRFIDYVKKPGSVDYNDLVVESIILKKLARGKADTKFDDNSRVVEVTIDEHNIPNDETYKRIYVPENQSIVPKNVTIHFPEFLDVAPHVVRFISVGQAIKPESISVYGVRDVGVEDKLEFSKREGPSGNSNEPYVLTIKSSEDAKFYKAIKISASESLGKPMNIDFDGRVTIRKNEPKLKSK